MNTKETVLEILCNRCAIGDTYYCEKCEKEGDYKNVEDLIDNQQLDFMNKEIFIKNMLKHVLGILNEKHEDMVEYELSMDSDTFLDMKSDIEDIINEVIENI